MTTYKDDCVSCGLPCMGSSCKYKNVPHYFCDKCGDECNDDNMYEVDGAELCEFCLKETTRIRR